MKVYRVTPDKRSPLTVYKVIGFIGVIIAVISGLGIFCMLQEKFVIVIGDIIIGSSAINNVLWRSLGVSILASIFAFDKSKLKDNDRCLDVFIKDERNHLYYVTLNREIFDVKLNMFLYFFSRNYQRYHMSMVRAWNGYCEDILCDEDVAAYLPSILQGKITFDDCPALLALRILNIENLHEGNSSMTFTFHADGSNRMWSAGIYDYMNDYEELKEQIKAKKGII